MLVKWSPFNELTRFERNMRSLFDFDVTNWRPAVDVYEDKEKITLEAELPGVKQEDVDITVDSGILTIKGEKKLIKENKNKEYFRVERSEGTFVRSFTLPSMVEVEKIEATHKDGILTINIPKKPEKIPKQIKIKSG